MDTSSKAVSKEGVGVLASVCDDGHKWKQLRTQTSRVGHCLICPCLLTFVCLTLSSDCFAP